MNNNYTKNIIITASITASIFLFLLFLIYVIYCYGFYDKNLKNELIKNYNNSKYDYIYEHLEQNDDYLTRDNYNNVINNTYDYNNIKKLYELYYTNSFSEDEFIDRYYYGNKHINDESFTFIKEGKTTITKRSDIKYNQIKLNNKNNNTTFGIINNIKLKIDEDSLIYIDNQGITCDKECTIDKIYGGIHTIKYIKKDFTFFGLINIKEDNQLIEINKLDTLVVLEKTGTITTNGMNKNNNKLIPGKYILEACYLTSSCPSPRYTYIILKEDNTVEFYTYITLDMAGDTYYGVYTQNNGFLITKFTKHTYRVHDYDTMQSTDIDVDTDISYTYKILEDNKFQNDMYKFTFKEQIIQEEDTEEEE